jgi:uncharacterized protein (TIGR03437 family)
MLRLLLRLAALIVASGVLTPAQQTVWFTPLPYTTHPVGFFGSTDYMSLFNPAAPWQQAASHVQVFKVYGVDNFSDADLTNILADLKRRNIALAMEWPVLSSSTCGAGIEGFGSSFLPAAQRIKALGGTLTYVAMQQPFQWGSLYKGPNSCQWTAQQVATNALVEINQVRTVFPNLLVGDIMAVPPFQDASPDWPTRYGVWFDTWRSLAGSPLAFFHVDADWTEPNWQAAVAAVRPVAAQRGIPFGMVYNGFLTNETDSAWMTAAENHFVDYEVRAGYTPPDQVNFQSWNPNPTRVLPETDPTAFTYLIDRYFRTRTLLTLANNGTQISGTLRAGSAAVAGASIQITAQPVSGSGAITTYTITGPVPTTARTAIVGARINSECYSCNGPSDLTIYSFQYSDTQRAPFTWNFSKGVSGWSFGPGAPVFDPGPPPYGQGLHITAQPNQALGLNSTSVPVTPGAQFTLQVTARVSPASVGSGYFTLIWFDAAGNEPSRETIMFQPQTLALGTATTATDGSFSTGNSIDPNLFHVTAAYAGSSTLWPASSVPAPTPTITAVVNAANYAKGPVSPGEIVSIGGTAIGPSTSASTELDQNGNVSRSLGGVQVLFNGIPAPLTYVSSVQINAVVPYEIANALNPSVQVKFMGQSSNAFTLTASPAAPALFTFNASGTGPGAILNQDNSYNGPANPAPRGSIVVLYLTGEGQTVPAGVTGKVTTVSATAPLTPRTLLPVAVLISGQPANVAFFGEAPGLVSGVMQINVQVPTTAPAGELPISVSVGGSVTQSGVTVSVR